MPDAQRPHALRPQSRQLAKLIAAACLLAPAAALPACSSAEIALRETFGQAKREQLVDRVEEARDEQEQAKEQFTSTLDEFKALTGFQGGDLEAIYDRLNTQLKRSKRQAEEVSSKITDVEKVASAMFSEWSSELKEYQSETLRRSSEDQLIETRNRYDQLLDAMKRAEASMAPVLAAFNDQVLLLKHNLNARAIASLEQNVESLETEIDRLIREMEASIAEADRFISTINN